MKKYVLVSTICIICVVQALGQTAPRIEDHFWRRKVVNRIDLNEKINAPLIKRESPFYTDNSQYSEKEGLIMALFNGLKQGKYVAYHPDSLESPLSYDDVLKRIKDFEGSLEGDFDEDLGDGEEGFDSFGGEGTEDEWPGFAEEGEGEEGLDALGEEVGGDALPAVSNPFMGDFDPAPYENVVHFVEDRIFDKSRSDMIYDIQFIEIIWTDPGETLPEKNLCTFAYKDVLETLDNSQWKNRFNDAEYKTLREVFESRLFHSYIINISGEGIRYLQEAEYRRQKIVEFEHHLWSY